MPGKMFFRTKGASQQGGLEQEDSRAMLRLIYLASGLTLGFFAVLQVLNGNLSPALVELVAALLGKTAGFYVTVPFATVAIAAYLIRHPEQFQGAGWIDMGNAVLSGLLIMLFVHVYEARRAAAQGQLRELAETDGLTGVANRSSFPLILNDSIAQADRSGQRLVLVLLDLDHFKAVNDRWGHAAGDQALRHTCDCIQQRLRRDDLLYRRKHLERNQLIFHDVLSAEVL